MGWLDDIFVGALGSGVNAPTWVLLNVVIGAAFLSLLVLLVHSIYRNPVLTPHVIVLLVLALGLWISINWLISNIGLTDAKEQQKELFGEGAKAAEGEDQAEEEEEQKDDLGADGAKQPEGKKTQ